MVGFGVASNEISTLLESPFLSSAPNVTVPEPYTSTSFVHPEQQKSLEDISLDVYVKLL